MDNSNGDAANPLDDLAVLRHTNVSRPQVERPSSKRSITAYTEDAAQSRPISGDSSQPLPPTSDVPPPASMDPHPEQPTEHMHRHGTLHPVDGQGAESFLPSTQAVLDRLADGAEEGRLPRQSQPLHRDDLINLDIRPTSSRYSGAHYSQVNPDVDPPTPGDDGPYLRFALDQLTRDEEVRGSRQYPTDRWSRPSLEEQEQKQQLQQQQQQQLPEERNLLVSNPVTEESQMYDETPVVEQAKTYPPPQVQRTTAVERLVVPPPLPTFSQNQVVTDEEPMQVPYAQETYREDQYPEEKSREERYPEETFREERYPKEISREERYPKEISHEERYPEETYREERYPEEPFSPPHQEPTLPIIQPLSPPQPTRQVISQKPVAAPAPAAAELLVAYDPEDRPLKKLPMILHPVFLLPYILLCILMLGALAFSGAWSSTHLGLWGYTAFGGGRWILFKYAPAGAGMLMLLWLFQIQVAVQRVTPFIAMASSNVKARSEAPLMNVHTTNFIFPKLYFFRAGQSVVGLCMFLFWLQIFSIPCFASLFNVYYYGPQGVGSWRWTAVQAIVWALVGLYFLLVVALLILALWLWKQHTGLKWVPRSLADYIALLDRSNVLRHYDNSDSFRAPKEFRERLSHRSDRLGYWSTSRRTNDFFYTIGDEGADVPQTHVENTRITSKEIAGDQDRGRMDHTYNTSGGREGPIAANLDPEENLYTVRYRYLPWYLRPFFVVVWCVIAIGLFIAYIVLSYISDPVRRGFSPYFSVAPDNEGFSTTNFFYSFIPACIGQLMFLLWLSVDYAYRRLQPYVNMSVDEGAPATKSLYLDYPYRLPVSVTLTALAKGDLHVAWFSFVSIVAAAIPVLAGGVFMSQFYVPTQEVRVSVQRPAWYTLNALTGIYAFSFVFIFIGLRKRRLPHAVTTLSEQFSWFYASRVLGEREWRSQALNKKEMRSRLYSATTAAEREFNGGRFAFGRFVGGDGQARLGIDRIGIRDRKVPMTARTWRSPSRSIASASPQPTPYQEKVVEEVPPRTTVNEGNKYEEVPPFIPEEKVAPQGLLVEAGPAHVNAPVVTSTTVQTAPGIYDPYARLETTGPAGFAVPTDIRPIYEVGSVHAPIGRFSGVTEVGSIQPTMVRNSELTEAEDRNAAYRYDYRTGEGNTSRPL